MPTHREATRTEIDIRRDFVVIPLSCNAIAARIGEVCATDHGRSGLVGLQHVRRLESSASSDGCYAEESVHTSAYDRNKALKGEQIDSAAVDLAPHPQPLSPSCLRGEGSDDVAKAGRKIRETPVKELKAERIAKRKAGSGKRIPRDGWLANLTLDGRKASGVYANRSGVRASDKGSCRCR